MKREMRKKAREIGRGEIDDILVKGEYGTLATIDEEGYPYALPLSYVYVNEAIYFHCAKVGHKLDNINKNDKVSFSVVTDTEVIPEKFT